MKKVGVAILVVGLVLSFSSASFAQLRKDLQIVRGKVSAIDTVKREIVVQNVMDEGNPTPVTVDAGALNWLKKDQEIIAFVNTTTKKLKSIRPVVKRGQQKAPMAAATATR